MSLPIKRSASYHDFRALNIPAGVDRQSLTMVLYECLPCQRARDDETLRRRINSFTFRDSECRRKTLQTLHRTWSVAHQGVIGYSI